MTPRRFWLCADDYGMAPGINRAIRDLIARGRLNATSVMTLAPAFNHTEVDALAKLRAGPQRLAIGLHVTFTAPFRPLSPGLAPLRNGAFLPLPLLALNAFLRRLDVETLTREVEAQLKAFVAAFGQLPDFVDGHQHAHVFPQTREAVLRAMAAQAPQAWLRQCGRPGPLAARLSDRKGLFLDWLSRNLRRRAAAFGIRTNPAFSGTYDFAPDSDFPDLFPRFLAELPEGGLVMCHPGFVDDVLLSLDPLTDLREREYAYFAGAEFPRLLQSRGLTLA